MQPVSILTEQGHRSVHIFATLSADPRHEQARQVLAKRHRPEVAMFVSAQNLAENPDSLSKKSPGVTCRKIALVAIPDARKKSEYLPANDRRNLVELRRSDKISSFQKKCVSKMLFTQRGTCG